MKVAQVKYFLDQFITLYEDDISNLKSKFAEAFYSLATVNMEQELVQMAARFIEAKITPKTFSIEEHHQFYKPLINLTQANFQLANEQPFFSKINSGPLPIEVYESLFDSLKTFVSEHQKSISSFRETAAKQAIIISKDDQYRNSFGQFSKEFKLPDKVETQYQPFNPTKINYQQPTVYIKDQIVLPPSDIEMI